MTGRSPGDENGATSSVAVTTRINKLDVTRTVAARTMLADFLRDDIGLRGTKLSCEMQVCGACSVLVDGRPVSACTYLAADVDGTTVTTVEGLTPSTGGLSHLQAAFVDNFALQCGFCTPGFLMMATALLAENPEPTEHEVLEYLEGNICRCTGYEPIVAAVIDAARRIREDSA
jgi:aerobic-type carbon monoxide dehydrogenase small subunit (CoxS/CutS family)